MIKWVGNWKCKIKFFFSSGVSRYKLTWAIISYFPGKVFLLIPSILYQKQPSSIALSQAAHKFISNCTKRNKDMFPFKAFAKYFVHMFPALRLFFLIFGNLRFEEELQGLNEFLWWVYVGKSNEITVNGDIMRMIQKRF